MCVCFMWFKCFQTHMHHIQYTIYMQTNTVHTVCLIKGNRYSNKPSKIRPTISRERFVRVCQLTITRETPLDLSRHCRCRNNAAVVGFCQMATACVLEGVLSMSNNPCFFLCSFLTHRVHVWYSIFTYIYHKKSTKVWIDIPYMDDMGM